MKDILTSMKDTSELMVDLAYSAVIYNNKDIAEEVLRLEEKMDTLDYHIKIAAMLAARRIEEAEELSGALQIASASEKIANAAGDIAKTAIYAITPPELKADLREAEEVIINTTVSPDSEMVGRTLEDIEPVIETGMWIIAIRRGSDWIYGPTHDTRIRENDVIFARGHEESVPLLVEYATCASYKKTDAPPSREIKGLTHAVDLIIEMKDSSELAIGLAYSAVLFGNDDLANEVIAIENDTDKMKYELQRWVLEAAKYFDNVDQLRGLLIIADSSEQIADAAYQIADVQLRDIELHPIMTMAVRESDEVITSIDVGMNTPIAGKTLGDLRLESETGMHIMALKRADRWIYSPSAKTVINEGDLLVARGSQSGEEMLLEMNTQPTRSLKSII